MLPAKRGAIVVMDAPDPRAAQEGRHWAESRGKIALAGLMRITEHLVGWGNTPSTSAREAVGMGG